MKKILIICMCLFLTGCFGEVGKGYLTKTCIKTEEYSGLKYDETVVLKYKNNQMVSIDITHSYDLIDDNYKSTLKSIRSSYISEIKELSKVNGIKIVTDDDIDKKYVNTYTFDYNSLSEDVIQRFNFNNEAHNLIKQYQVLEYKCK